MTIPEAFWELSIEIYLIVKGFRPSSPVLAGPAEVAATRTVGNLELLGPFARRRVDWPPRCGGVAEWLGRGLQSLVHRFDSGPRLEVPVASGKPGRLAQGESASLTRKRSEVQIL
jgi:hypothetical protein